MALHIFGDSHANYLFGRARGAKVHWLRGRTMHRIGRDGVDFLESHVGSGDTVLCVFGEVDVRCHIVRLASERHGDIESIARDLARRYIDAVHNASIRLPASRFAVMGVVPPIDPMKANAALPVVGSLAERIRAREALNGALDEYSASRVTYVPVPNAYEEPDGSLQRHLSDGHAHIAMDCAGPACELVEQTLGVRLDFQQPSTIGGGLKAAGRRLAIAGRHHLALYKLGTL